LGGASLLVSDLSRGSNEASPMDGIPQSSAVILYSGFRMARPSCFIVHRDQADVYLSAFDVQVIGSR
jgi:hypothetical protein